MLLLGDEVASLISVQWLHSNPNYPIELLSELDNERNEVRKVEIFADGRMQFANSVAHTLDTVACSPKPDPGVMRVYRLLTRQGDSQDERQEAHAGADH